MTKIDKLYLEKLGEVLYDEKKAINYKTVSIMMGVHVNIAKQMLYHMHKNAKAAGKDIYATYYISGMMPRKVLLNIGRTEESEDSSQQSQPDEMEQYLVSISRENDMEDLKAKYSKIFSTHVYSLSAFPIENYDVLDSLVEFPMKDNEGRTPVDFGPIMSSASQKLSDTTNRKCIVPIPNNDMIPKSKIEESKKKVDSIKQPVVNGSTQDSPKKDISQETKSQKLAKPAIPDKKDANRLKSMFASAPAKPKPQPKKVENEKEVDSNEIKDKPVKSRETKSGSKSKDIDTRKRKRIRDVLSSDSEDDAKMSDDEEDSSSDSPAPRKRIQIESDSDDDFKEVVAKTKETSPVNDKKSVVPNRRRVTKTVSKSFVDKDGFLVTTKEQVMVSEDEDAEKETVESKKPKIDSSKPTESVPKKPAEQPGKPNMSGKNASGKTKQVSLMSFFQKK